MLYELEVLQNKLQTTKEKSQERTVCMKRLIEAALKFTFYYGFSGMRFLPRDEAYMTRIFLNLIITQENAFRIKDIFMRKNSMELFWDFLEEKRIEMEKIYKKYFDSKTVIYEDRKYSPLLKMYWDPVSEIWISKDEDGTVRFTAYMSD